MRYVEYGKTGKKVSVVGFGGMRFDLNKSKRRKRRTFKNMQMQKELIILIQLQVIVKIEVKTYLELRFKICQRIFMFQPRECLQN